MDRATIAVARFDASAVTSIPLLQRGESVESSRIEQLTSLSRKIFEAELSGVGSANTKLIVANVRQMQRAIEVDAATTETLLAMHGVLLRDSVPESLASCATKQCGSVGRMTTIREVRCSFHRTMRMCRYRWRTWKHLCAAKTFRC
nr:hypothetical protein [Corynebacterium sp. NML180780]